MKSWTLATVSIALVTSLNAFANPKASSSQCLPADRIVRLFDTFKFGIHESVKDGSEKDGWGCKPNTSMYRTMQALIQIEDLPLMNTTKDAFNRNSFGLSATQFIRHRVKRITIAKKYRSCGESGVVGFVRGGDTSGTFFVCEDILNVSPLWGMLVMIHESRHLDSDDNSHVPCRTGPLKDDYACDSTYEQRGSYGVHTEFAVRLSRTEKVAKELREEARAEAISSFLVRFNALPLGLEPGVFAQDKNNMFFVSSKNAVLILSNAPDELLTVRNSQPYWFNSTAGTVTAFDLSGKEMHPQGSFSEEYKSEWTPPQRSEIQDISYDGYFCFLTTRALDCTSNADKKRTIIDLSSYSPQNFINLKNQRGVAMRNGDIYLLPTSIDQLQGSTIKHLKKIKNKRNYTNYQWVSDYAYALNQNGILVKTKDFESEGFAPSFLQNIRFEKIVGPTTWSPLLKDL